MIDIIGRDYFKNHTKWYDDKSIYDANDEESTSSSRTDRRNRILVIVWLTMLELKLYIFTRCLFALPNISVHKQYINICGRKLIGYQ